MDRLDDGLDLGDVDGLDGDDSGGDVGGPRPPDDTLRTGGGGGGRDLPPRRDIWRYIPFLALGALALAVERLTLLALASQGLSTGAQAIAASVFLAMVLTGIVVGGRAFYRAWEADRA